MYIKGVTVATVLTGGAEGNASVATIFQRWCGEKVSVREAFIPWQADPPVQRGIKTTAGALVLCGGEVMSLHHQALNCGLFLWSCESMTEIVFGARRATLST